VSAETRFVYDQLRTQHFFPIIQASDNKNHDELKQRPMTSTRGTLSHAQFHHQPPFAPHAYWVTVTPRPLRYPTRTALRPSADQVSMVKVF